MKEVDEKENDPFEVETLCPDKNNLEVNNSEEGKSQYSTSSIQNQQKIHIPT